MEGGWIAVDLDGTLAHYDGWKGAEHIGAPVPAMVEKVLGALATGKTVRIFTARCYPLGTLAMETTPLDRLKDAWLAVSVIEKWCAEHIGHVLPVTCVKDFAMVELWDDRARHVIPNTGEFCCGGKA